MIDPCRLEYEKIIKQRPPEEKEDKEPWHNPPSLEAHLWFSFVSRRKTVVHVAEPVDVTPIATIEGVGEGGEIASQTFCVIFMLSMLCFRCFLLVLLVFFRKLCNHGHLVFWNLYVWPGAMIGEMEMTDGMGDGVGTEGVEIGGGALITTGTAGRVLWVLEMWRLFDSLHSLFLLALEAWFLTLLSSLLQEKIETWQLWEVVSQHPSVY